MKLEITFQTEPEVDVYSEPNMTTEAALNSVLVGVSYLKDLRTKKVIQEDKSIKYERYLHNITDDDWQKLQIIHLNESLIIDHSKNKEGFTDKIKYFHVSMDQLNTTDKVLYYGPGVFQILYYYFEDTTTILSEAISISLKNQNIDIPKIGNDWLIGDQKIAGSAVVGNYKYKAEFVIFTFDYDEEQFKNLPDQFLKRSYVPGNEEKTESGISGVLQHYPDFDVNLFVTDLIQILQNNKEV